MGPSRRDGLLGVWLVMSVALLWGSGSSFALTNDVFTIQATVDITATDTYKYRYYNDNFLQEKTDATDSLTYHFVGRLKTYVPGNGQPDVESSACEVSGAGSTTTVDYDRSGLNPPETQTLSWTYNVDPDQVDPASSEISFDILRTPDLVEFDWPGPAQEPSVVRFPDRSFLWR